MHQGVEALEGRLTGTIGRWRYLHEPSITRSGNLLRYQYGMVVSR